MEDLFVLEYDLGDLHLYLTPDNTHTIEMTKALKFLKQDEAEQYLVDNSKQVLLSFKPKLHRFEFIER